ncbi:uncharacterized protein LOC130738309 [Lotus japonicus]|uniref:uncharacterized protein LOC130738309 n=1 Tax=Lotus japonicus TaxID=34305 RepID=UPI00258CA637|nr:uncharacterized protein LOC130738309 [Lotus japonicus]
MDPNNHHYNTQNSSSYPISNQNPNNYEDPNQFSYPRPQNPTNYQVPHQFSNQRPQNPNYFQVPHQFSNQHPQNPNYYPDPNQYSNQSSFVPNFHPSYGSVRYPSQTPQSSGYMPMVRANFPSVDGPEFPEFSTQVNLGDGSADNEVNEVTPKSKKTHAPAWNTAQNMVLISGWINCGTSSVVGKNQKGETFWRDIAEYCNEHCSFDPPRDGIACRNRWNYMNKILGKWIGAYDAAKRQQGSGWSDNDVLAKAQELFACGKNVQFTLMEEWIALRDLPRFCSQVGGNGGSASSGSKRSHDSDACGSTTIGSIPRPMGREAAKRKNKKKSKEPVVEEKGKVWVEYKDLKAQEIARIDKLTMVQEQTNQLMKTNLYLKLSSEEDLDDRKKELLSKLAPYLQNSQLEEAFILNQLGLGPNQNLEDSAPRRKYVRRDHAAANRRLIDDYFANEPTYDDSMFRRRYRMQKHVFLRIVGDLSSSDNYFTQRVDAAKKEGISPLAKCTTAMRMLAYGVAADAVDEYIKIGGTTALECLRRFCNGIIRLYEHEYLRAPTQEDLQRILQVSEQRGFPGMIGSIDCMHWEWKNCPKAWEGQFTRGDKGTTTVILEAVGKAPTVSFIVNQRPYNMAYYLADGIYPSYPTFVKSIRLPQSEPDKLFAQVQERCRKDIERAFGVLQARFKIIREPARLWDIADLGIIMRSCIILHNMIVEDERDTFAQRWTDFEQSGEGGSSTPQPYSTEVLPAFANHVRARSELRDSNVHHELQADLVKHIWTKFANAS